MGQIGLRSCGLDACGLCRTCRGRISGAGVALNRNTWAGLALARTLLHMVVAASVPSGPIIIGLDRTVERRRGPRIGPVGRFYDASRRADTPKPTSRGLRWLSTMVLADVPFAGRI